VEIITPLPFQSFIESANHVEKISIVTAAMRIVTTATKIVTVTSDIVTRTIEVCRRCFNKNVFFSFF